MTEVVNKATSTFTLTRDGAQHSRRDLLVFLAVLSFALTRLLRRQRFALRSVEAEA